MDKARSSQRGGEDGKGAYKLPTRGPGDKVAVGMQTQSVLIPWKMFFSINGLLLWWYNGKYDKTMFESNLYQMCAIHVLDKKIVNQIVMFRNQFSAFPRVQSILLSTAWTNNNVFLGTNQTQGEDACIVLLVYWRWSDTGRSLPRLAGRHLGAAATTTTTSYILECVLVERERERALFDGVIFCNVEIHFHQLNIPKPNTVMHVYYSIKSSLFMYILFFYIPRS